MVRRMGYCGHWAPDSFAIDSLIALRFDTFDELSAAAVVPRRAETAPPGPVDYNQVSRCLEPLTKDLEHLWPIEG